MNVKNAWFVIRAGLGSMSDFRSRTTYEQMPDHISGSTTYRVEMMVCLRREKNDIPSILVPLRGALESHPGIKDADLDIHPDKQALFISQALSISMSVDADSDDIAIDRAIVAVRTAIHQIGNHTARWQNILPSADDFVSSAKHADPLVILPESVMHGREPKAMTNVDMTMPASPGGF